MYRNLILNFSLSIVLISCKSNTDSKADNENTGSTPVTITHIRIGTIEQTVDLNATSAFQLKTPIKSTTNGYLQDVFVQTGELVNKGQKLFTLKTKEAEYLNSSLNSADSTLKFKGNITVFSSEKGYIAQISHIKGDYVQDGETIATIISSKSMVFLLEIPYELKPYIHLNKTVKVTLEDNTSFDTNLSESMPEVDLNSQTQKYLLKISEKYQIPENLIANVKFVKQRKINAVLLSKEAILSNETQSEFWIMKAIDSITAVKIPITKGLENNQFVEIISPELKINDMILLTGNYGLPDTAKISIEK